MLRITGAGFATVFSAAALAAPIIPTAPGTGWRYNLTEEIGKGLDVANAKRDADGKIRCPVLYRLEGIQNVDGKNLLKFEMHRNGLITNTDLLTVDENGIACWGRMNLDGETVRFNPPQIIVSAPLKTGLRWDFNGRAGDFAVRQHYDLVGEEDIEVPAGEFHAFHIRGEQTAPSPMTIERWFAPGTGIVKDITTMRAANGDLLQRISLELAEQPRIMARPEVKPVAAPKQISVTLAKDQFGKATTVFSSETPRIYVRWQGQRLRKGAKVKAVWVAENIGQDFPQDYKADEASTVAESPTAQGTFTLARPEAGWAAGSYRVEFYLDDVLVESVKLKIVQ
jgi:hypothetical protein